MTKNISEEEVIKFNWKCQAITTITKDQYIFGVELKKGDYMIAIAEFDLRGKKIALDMPNFCALYLDMADKLYKKSDGYLVSRNFKNQVPNNHEELFSHIQDRISNIIFSYTGLEAFLNENIAAIENHELGYIYKYKDKKTGKKEQKGINKIIEKFSIPQKIKVIYEFYEIQHSSEIDKKISDINTLRNRLIHFKRKDTISNKKGDKTIFDELLNINLQNYAVLVYEVINYFMRNSKEHKKFSAYWFNRPDNCFVINT